MNDRLLPDQIADFLIALIFIKSLKPGDRLPAERRLSELLQVDRTSLRTALKTLIRMGLLDSVQGSGITVLDPRRHAGVDMLDAVLRIPELEIGSRLMIQLIESFIRTLPTMVRRAIEMGDRRERAEILAQLHIQISRYTSGANVAELAAIDVSLQDMMADRIDHPLAIMTANSTRRLRHMLTTMLYEKVNLESHFDAQLNLIEEAISGVLGMGDMQKKYASHIHGLSRKLVAHLATLPPDPHLKASPLTHLPDLRNLPE
ncbi:MAG: FadR/GntR family transcriptional regulator [Alcanivoracaceae bacterium]